MDLHKDNNVKVIAFYLPQFHCIPENDATYGKGFTEWVNTKKAVPLFEGHYQPRTPLNDNYYCLDDMSVMARQAKQAKEYGVSGFCFYHYWFKGGKKLLEKPVENFLKEKEIDIPFCLSWANENWSKRWDGGNGEVIAKQEYGNKDDWKKHFDYLLNFFQDKRYITIDDKPVLLIYRPDLIPHVNDMLNYFRKRAKESGFPGIILMAQHPTYFVEHEKDIFDNYVQFQPAFVNKLSSFKITDITRRKVERFILNTFGSDALDAIKTWFKGNNKTELQMHDYDKDWISIINYTVTSDKVIAGAFVDWDNTPRNKKGMLYKGATPEKFENYMKALISKIKSDYKENVIFINAWNEWAEGAYLEPDERYGYSYLEAFRNSLKNK